MDSAVPCAAAHAGLPCRRRRRPAVQELVECGGSQVHLTGMMLGAVLLREAVGSAANMEPGGHTRYISR
jgi:hypothetical protein